jgi:hypothetical protein
VVVTDEQSGATLFTTGDIGSSSFTIAQRQPTHDTAGVASLYAGSGEPVEARFAVHGRIKVVVANGDSAKIGTLWFWIDEGR